ncbi:MAG: ATP-binding protein [Proteobacteria bacterium]|nr:ATP-binding protein [Pseudomonadota bacterium]MDA0993453.1 ATP-binding protein [Pseudomonadota bacterium]
MIPVSSLSARLLLSVSLLLVFFFGVTIVVLNSAFSEAGEQAQEDILDGQLMALIAAAEPNERGELEMPADLSEPRFSNLGSGLFGALTDESEFPVWTSRSSLGIDVPYGSRPAAGTRIFSRVELEDGTPLMALSLHVQWELATGNLKPYTFSVAQSLDSFNAQLAAFRRQIFTWFAAVALIMLFSISIVMRGLLKPLRKIESEISDVESGRRQSLSEDFPDELSGVARNMNLLIGSERGRSDRYRYTLDNLAHSLKTPLAAIRAVLSEQPSNEGTEKIETQIERMNDIVRYQLSKPAAEQRKTFGVVAVAIDKELKKLVDGLSKVYTDKNPTIEVDVSDGILFRGETGDFLELAGNLLDNACKSCKSTVKLSIRPLAGQAAEFGGMRLVVEDDGPGIPENARETLLQRGMRLDESAPGQGIGLAVVADIAASYSGNVKISESSLGGAKIAVSVNPS